MAYDTYLLLRVLPGMIFKVGKDLHDNSTRVREVYNELGAPRSTANTLAALERLATEPAVGNSPPFLTNLPFHNFPKLMNHTHRG